MASIHRIPLRRVVPAALVVGMILSILPAATLAGGSGPMTVASAEWGVLQQVNRIRQNRGLAPLRMDDDVQHVASSRSGSMKQLGYFAHVSPSGQDASDLLRRQKVGHRYWGEVIGWTRYMSLEQGSSWMVDWWMHSPGHRELLLSRRFNYAGVGIVKDGPRTLWTIVFVNTADRTAPIARVVGPVNTARVSGTLRPATAAGRTKAATNGKPFTTVQWWGRDRRLATRTSGLHSFTIQHKLPGGSWETVLKGTRQRQWSWQLRSGAHAFRVRARDRAGNVGEWEPAVWVQVP